MPRFEVINSEGRWMFEDMEDDDAAHAAWLVDHAGDADQSVEIRPVGDPPELPERPADLAHAPSILDSL